MHTVSALRRHPSCWPLRCAAVAVGLILCAAGARAQTCAYVANNGGDSVSVIDIATRQVIRTIAVGVSPTLPAVTPDGHFVYVTITADFQNPGVPDGVADRVDVIDTTSGQVVKSIPVGDGPKGIAFTPDGRFAYVADNFSDQVSVIDTAAGSVLTTIAVGKFPDLVALTPDGATAYVTNFGADTVSAISTATNMVVTPIRTGRFPAVVAFTPDGARAYVTNRGGGTVSVLDVTRSEPSDTITLGPASLLLAGIGITPDGTHAFIASEGTDRVLRVETASQLLTGDVPVGDGPRGLAITPDGTAVYVANFFSDTVSVIDTTSLDVTTINVGHAPKGIAVAGVAASCPPPAPPEPTPSATATLNVPSPTPTMTRSGTPTRTPTQPPTGGCCFCPTPGSHDECTAPQAGVCSAAGCVYLPNSVCIDTGTELANCISARPTPTSTPSLTLTVMPTPSATLTASPTRTATSLGHGHGWVTLASLPAARQEVGAALLNGRAYVVGGLDENGATLTTVEYYDPDRDAWFGAAPLPEPLHHVAAAVVGGRLYSIGGLRTLQSVATDAVYAYDPTANTWTSRAALPAPRGAASAAVIDGLVYVAGGQRGGAAVSDFAVYDPEADRWTVLPALPTKRDHLGAAAIDGIFYAVGGRDGGELLGVLQAYNPTTSVWRTDLPPMRTPRGGHAVAALGKQLYTFGGEGNREDASGVFPQAEAYDVETNSWTALPDMPTPRHGAAAVALVDRIVVAAGATRIGFGPSATNEALIVGPPPAGCAGDCDDGAAITAAEIDAGIALIFDPQATERCALATFDSDRDGRVTAAEVVAAVRHIQLGCGGVDVTPTPPATPCVEFCNHARAEGLADRPRYGRGTAFADIDGDGWDDLWIADADDRLHPGPYGVPGVYKNQGDGTFVEVDIGIDPNDVFLAWGQSFADFDNDGDLDVVLANGGYGGTSNLVLYRNDLRSTGRFTNVSRAAGLTPLLQGWWGVAWADYDNDGFVDFIATPLTGRPWLYHNQGDGTFVDVTASVGIDVVLTEGKNPVWFDYDLDGDPDLYIATMYAHRLYRNDGADGFTNVTDLIHFSDSSPEFALVFAAAAADFNQDGWPDLYLGRWSWQDWVLLNGGNGTFTAYATTAGLETRNDPDESENTMGLGVGDINEDGYPDVLIGAGNPRDANFDIIFCNDGQDATQPVLFHRCSDAVVHGHGAGRTHGIVIGDPDHDGDADIFYNRGGHPGGGFGGHNPDRIDQRQFSAYYERQPNVRPNTATLHLTGTLSNRDALGARIRVQGTQTRYYTVQSTQGYQSQNSAWILVSLGTATSGTATITWPSTKVTTLTIHAGERINVTE